MKKYGLVRKPDNYRFFDPQSRLHLTLEKPVGEASQVTPGITRGIDSKVIVEISGEVPKTGIAVQADDPALRNEKFKQNQDSNKLPNGLPDLTKESDEEDDEVEVLGSGEETKETPSGEKDDDPKSGSEDSEETKGAEVDETKEKTVVYKYDAETLTDDYSELKELAKAEDLPTDIKSKKDITAALLEIKA